MLYTENKIKYKLLLNSTGVTVVCTFLNANSFTSTKSCIVVVHQRVNLLNSSGLLNIDSYIFTRDGATATGFIEGLNIDEYQIGVFGGYRRVPSESNTGLPSTLDTSKYTKSCFSFRHAILSLYQQVVPELPWFV